MRRKMKVLIPIIIAAIVIPSLIYTVSPLFINTPINEAAPGLASVNFEKFMNMSEEGRIQAANKMDNQEKQMILTMAAKENNAAHENLSGSTNQAAKILLTGTFVGAGDGFHNAEGISKIIQIENDTNILRLENLKATNGPDLYVYLSTGKTATDFISLGRLKGNIGNQNYAIPSGTDLTKYNTVLIWCRAFSVLFGSARLS